VATFRLRGDTGVRQMGFQETDIVEMCRTITKYAVMLLDPKRIRYELEKACHLARSGRPGPVLIDIPDNLQREEIEPAQLESFTPRPAYDRPKPPAGQMDACLGLIAAARRPVFIVGWGIRLAKAEAEAMAAIEALGFPVVPTWGALDMIPADHPLLVGSFGLHGTRYGNFAVQNADLILAVGTRLDTHETGSPLSSFAREAKRIIIDIDPTELAKFEKFGLKVDLPVHADAKEFLSELGRRLKGAPKTDLSDWKVRIAKWKADYPICTPAYRQEKDVNPYVFIKSLSRAAAEGAVFFLDTGCAVAWTMQAFDFKKGQRMFHAFNNTPMGYGLPASIGACIALGKKEVVYIAGDGSLQMNIQELATVMRHRLPIKIFLFNNHGYSMIQQTQDQWLGSRYEASTVEGGLAFPDFVAVAKAYGFPTLTIRDSSEVDEKVRQAFAADGPVFCDVDIKSSHRVIPQVVFGRPIEDPGPLLPRPEFLSNMVITPAEASLK
jgi:acetolactate synthase-1/2/3 large subunit